MNNDVLVMKLAKQAHAKGICEEWHTQLLSLDDKDKMVQMYLRGIDFCLANDYPSNELIRDNFKGSMEKHGVYLDERQLLVKDVKKCVCLGNTNGKVEINGFNVSEIFVKNDSALCVIARDNSFVMVDAFDNTSVMVYAKDNAKVCVNRYGRADVKTFNDSSAQIKVREKNKKTY